MSKLNQNVEICFFCPESQFMRLIQTTSGIGSNVSIFYSQIAFFSALLAQEPGNLTNFCIFFITSVGKNTKGLKIFCKYQFPNWAYWRFRQKYPFFSHWAGLYLMQVCSKTSPFTGSEICRVWQKTL